MERVYEEAFCEVDEIIKLMPIDLKSKINVREFYRQFLELRQSGKLLWSKCPFHNDSDPSFSIDETTGIWKCWSENISGDIIDFYERLTGKSFTDSVLDIAKSQNVKAKTVVMSGTYVSIGLSSGPATTYNVYLQSEWYGRTADATISTLKQKLSVECPGVIFKFEKRSSNTGAAAGIIHESSPTKGGQNSFTQGKTYTFYIIN